MYTILFFQNMNNTEGHCFLEFVVAIILLALYIIIGDTWADIFGASSNAL